MYISLNWLKDYVEIPKSITPEKLGLLLTTHTVEVDGVEDQSEKYRDVIVGEVLEVNKHPNADRLKLVQVDVGNKRLNIVCGADNYKKGDKVPVALAGAVLPNGMEIKKAEVRGEISEGMMCAEDELGLGDDHTGIFILDKKASVGQNFAAYLKLDDVIIELDNKSITHRPDLWGIYGIARDVSAFLETKLKNNNKVDLEKLIKPSKKVNHLKIQVKDSELCPRYMAIQVDNITIEDSPKWMQERLIAVGMRPINNIVDITNYVMLELGQPLHAFDSALVDEIIVRRAKNNEKIKTLDRQDRKLDDSMLVIADSKKAIAIAGVMGGETSEVSQKTNSIIIESANFDPVATRKTAQSLNLRTEAASRFEKSLDPNLCELALARTLELINKIIPKAKIASQLVDEKDFKLDQGPIQLNLDWLNTRIGKEIEADRVIKILESLGFEVEVPKNVKKDITLQVTVPTWRATKDVSIPEDLVEEVARIYGYDNIEPEMPQVALEVPRFNKEKIFEREVKDILTKAASLSEVYNYSFVGEEQLTKINIDPSSHIMLANPIASHQTLLRQSLIPNILENIKLNQAKFESVEIFEIGSVYMNFQGDVNKDESGNENLPYQEKKVALAIAGDSEEVFDRIKGVIDLLVSSFDLRLELESSDNMPNWADKKITANIKVNDNALGMVTMLSAEVAKKIGVKKILAIAEISLRELYHNVINLPDKKYKDTPKYPPVVRDLAFIVDNKIMYAKIKKEIENFDPLVKEVELFDVFEGEKLGKNKRNLAFHITYQADRTMKGDEVEKLQKKLSNHLEKNLGVQTRDF